ncbi:MAG: cation:proton antiporter, partial [Acidimicrobiales bacterium]
PELVAFLIVGAIFGPSGRKLIDSAGLTRLGPVTEVALAILMFMVGERVSVRSLRGSRWVVLTGFLSYVLPAGAVAVVASALGASPVTVILLAVLAGAGAPLTVQSVASSVKARGRYPNGMIGAHAVSDALAAVCFAIALPVVLRIEGVTADTGAALLRFARLGIGGAILGVVLGLIVAKLSVRTETTGELLLLALVHLLGAATIAAQFDLSLPLAALVMGAVAASVAPPDSGQRVFVAVRSVEQPLYLIFFALAGASIHLEDIPKVGAVGAGYIVVRTITKVLAGFLGGLSGKLVWRRALRLGGDLVPQAGVAVGLAVVAAEQLPAPVDAATIVLGSVVVFELIGPFLVSRSLRRLPAEAAPTEENDQQLNEELPAHVLLASAASLDIPTWVLDWCARTGAALNVLAPGSDRETGEDDQLDRLRSRAAQEGVPVHWHQLAEQETFASSVVTCARENRADLVIVVTAPMSAPSLWLRAGPVERITSQLSCPVLLLPGRDPTPQLAQALSQMMLGGKDR